jgi:uncharacterized protein YukE
MSEILYNFAANNSALEDITGNVAAMEQAKDELNDIFNVLSTVYTGQTATDWHARQQALSSQFEGCLADVRRSQTDAQAQQDAMQALDNHNAASM